MVNAPKNKLPTIDILKKKKQQIQKATQDYEYRPTK